MEYRYSTKCPAHHQKIETRRNQTFKYRGISYGGPIFYCNRCKKYYLFVEGKGPFEKLKTVASSGLTIEIRKGSFEKALTKKSKAAAIDTKGKIETESKKTKNSGKKGKNKHKEIIEKNNRLKMQLKESLKQIRCEMKCPNHPDRVMTTKNCIDVENHKKLPLFFCIDCDCYYVSCADIKQIKLGHIREKGFFNCYEEVITTNPENGTLNSVGAFSSTEDIEEECVKVEHFENNEAIAIGPEIHEISSIYVEKNQDDVEIESNTQVIKPGKILHTTENSTKSISNRINFEDWSFEDTEDELFKDFIQKD